MMPKSTNWIKAAEFANCIGVSRAAVTLAIKRRRIAKRDVRRDGRTVWIYVPGAAAAMSHYHGRTIEHRHLFAAEDNYTTKVVAGKREHRWFNDCGRVTTHPWGNDPSDDAVEPSESTLAAIGKLAVANFCGVSKLTAEEQIQPVR